MKEITDYLLTLGWRAEKYMGDDEIVSPDGGLHVKFEDYGYAWTLSKLLDGSWVGIEEGDTLDELKIALAVIQ